MTKILKQKYTVDLLELAYEAPDNVIKDLESMTVDECREIGSLETEIKLVKIEPKSYLHNFAINVADYDYDSNNVVYRQYGYLRFGSPNKNRRYIYIRVANQVLTDPYLMGCRFRVEEMLGLNFVQVTKLDIACDTNVDLVKRFFYYLRQPTLTFILFERAYKGDEEGLDKPINEITTYAKGSRANPLLHKGFSLAGISRAKDKKDKEYDESKDPHTNKSKDGLTARCYDKKYEIEQHSGKDYLKKRSGITDEEKMFRLEASITNHKHIVQTLKLMNDEIGKYNENVAAHNSNLAEGVERLGLKSFITEAEIYSRLCDESFLKKWFLVTMDRMCRIRWSRREFFSLIELLSVNPTKFKKAVNTLFEKDTMVH